MERWANGYQCAPGSAGIFLQFKRIFTLLYHPCGIFMVIGYVATKSNIFYTRGITPKLVTSGGAHLSGLASGQHSFEETLQWSRAVGDNVPDLTDPGIEPQTSRTDSSVLTTELTVRLLCKIFRTLRTTTNG